MHASRIVLLAAALAACGGAVHPAEPPLGIVEPPALLAAEAGAPEASASVDASSGPTLHADVDDALEWLRAHGVAEDVAKHTFSLDGPGPCHELEIGAPPQPALDCREREQVTKGSGAQSVYRDVTHERLRVVTAGKPRVVADVIVRISATDFPDFVVLELTLVANDPTALTLADPHDACRAALAALDGPGRNKDPSSRALDALDRSLVTRACALRGRLAWSVERFVSAP